MVAAQMGMQVIHWEKEGVMDIFKNPESEAVMGIDRLIEKTPALVAPIDQDISRDNVGAALLHWSVIHKGVFLNRSAGVVVEHLMASGWKNVVNVCYNDQKSSHGLFDGESALHLAVAFGDTKLIKLFLRSGADPMSRAYGTFFAPSGTNYFGEYPLSFAVACGNLEVAEILIAENRAAQLLFARDSFGNIPLHIAAIHRRKELLDWLLEKMDESKGDEMDSKEVLNMHGGSGLTPLGFATVLAHKDNGAMFDFILGRMSRIEWVFGRVSCTSVPLDQLDTIPLEPQTPLHISLLTVVLCKRIYELSTHPHLVGIMEAKWSQYGSTAFFAAFLCHLLRLFLMTYLAVQYRSIAEHAEDANAFNATDCGSYYTAEGELISRDDSLLTQLEWICFADAVAQCLVVFLDCYAGYAEYVSQKTIIKEQIKRAGDITIPPYLAKQVNGEKVFEGMVMSDSFMQFASTSVTGWLDSHVPLSEYDYFAWIGQVLVIAHFIGMLASDMCPTPFSSGVLSISLLFIWMSSLKFTAFSRELGMLTTIVFRTIKSDVSSFLVIFSIFLIGFGTALHVIAEGKGSLTTALDHLVKLSLGDTAEFSNWAQTLESDLSWLAYFLHLVFATCALVILLNLLISIFSCTFTSVREHSEREWRLSKGRATLLLERRLKLLFPCLTGRMRVNHFAEDAIKKHRYVFMTEHKDDDQKEDEKASMAAAVKAAVEQALSEQNRKTQTEADAPAIEEITFNHYVEKDQPSEVPLDKSVCDTHEIMIQDDNTDDMEKTANRQNPLSNLSNLMAGRVSMAAEQERVEEPWDCFDQQLGDGSWEKFKDWVVNEFGNITNLHLLSEDECYALCDSCFPDCASPLNLTKCSESLHFHAKHFR